MSFNPCLLIMQPREIKACLDSYKNSFDIPTVYFRAFSEPMVVSHINKYIKEHDYSHYIVSGDDAIITRQAADCVLKYTEDDRYDFFTGWMNMHLEKDGSYSEQSTVSQSSLLCSDRNDGPTREDYGNFLSVEHIRRLPPEPFRTSYANFALTGSKKEMWEKFPIRCWPRGNSSDHHLSLRLQESNIKVWTHPMAFIKHLRRGWSPLTDKWLTWNVEPEIIETNI